MYGNTISIPGQITITNPGNGQNMTFQASVGIGPSGLLVEDNGSHSISGGVPPVVFYQNALGAGTGAVGLPKPSSPIDTGTLVGAQYLGITFGPGLYSNSGPIGAFSTMASFGFSRVSQPHARPFPAPPTATVLYGGDFTGNDPCVIQQRLWQLQSRH